MASSQVEISLTSPFGCVLRKYSHRERFRESTSSRVSSSQVTLQSNNDRRSLVVVGDHRVDNICNNNAAPQIDVVKNNNNNNNNMNNAKEKEDESSVSSSNNNVNPRQSQIMDRWAARKAKEIVSTIETEAELLENLGSSATSSSETLNNRVASSLVQIWEKRLNNNNQNGQSLKCNITTSRTSSLGSSDVGEIFTDESSYSDWATSDTNNEATTCSTPKVADIIKRLKENNYYGQDQQSNNSKNNNNNNNMMMMMGFSSCLSSREQGQGTSVVLHHVARSPRLRGRKALTDLLMQMERDRNGELNNLAQLAPVSNFSRRGRGRIQSLLRLRLLKRHHESTIYEAKRRQPKGSTIMQLRERFNIEAKQESTTQLEIVSSSNTHSDQPENPLPPPNPKGEHGSSPIRSDRVVNETNGHQNDNDHSVACGQESESSQTNEEEEAHASSSETVVCLEAQNIIASSSQEVAERSSCNMVDSSDANHETKEDEADVAEVKRDDNNSVETEINYVEEAMNMIEQDHEYASEGNDYDEQNYEDDEHYYDWISSIARPRSYWEDRRQAWYKEMLDTASSDNKLEIRQLLQRRTVSTFLSSDFRERMDKLMEYHIGTQTQFISSQEDNEDNEGRMGQLMSFLQQHIQRHGSNLEEEEAEKQEVQEEEEEESLSSSGYTETSDDGNQSSSSSSTQNLTSSSPNMSSWSYRDNETSDDSDRVDESATSSTQTSRSLSFYQDSHQSSSSNINPHSMEMDLIYDMRGQMEQLYREMAEIRKSLKSCIDMQMMLQQSMKREVNSEREKKKKKKKKSSEQKKAQKKGQCCICYEKKVDSLLYRCGHMCTCLKCANELQWNSGKCPICRAPIADVVRVYVDA